MNKNLKRVISAVSALAVTASGAAAFAISYPDVPETADYNQAITELSALGVINGFDDGTFRPDENVTRAQITKMVVTALGNTAVSQAEASTGRDTQFSDVPGSHWASGFVSVGTSSTASNFINGYSATTFGPEDNVTYAQAVKMVVAALGYTTLAEGQGGWPSGYLKYGYQLGIATLSGVGNDDQLNRAQVSVIIDNALKCPICVANGYTYDALGRQIPNTLIKDGTGDLDDTKDGYQNLLNYAHDAYLVYGRVIGTFKTGGADSDEVRYNVEKADNWDGYEVNASKNSDADNITVYKGMVQNADDYLFTYSQAIIKKDKNDEYTLISLVPYGASETVVLDSADFKKITKSGTDYQLQMYKDSAHSKYDTYKLNSTIEDSDSFGLYVNGREIGENVIAESLENAVKSGLITDSEGTEAAKYNTTALFYGEYVKGNKVGKITLIDATDEGKSSTDGKYDYVMVSYYVDGIVDEVDEKTDEVNIILDTCDAEIKGGKIVIDLDDDDKDYNISYDGEKIAASEIKKDDVVSVAFDVNNDFRDSDTYDIFVSRNTVDGKCTSASQDDYILDREYTLDNGEVYNLAFEDVGELTSGTSYTLYLDAFGKVAKHEELASSKKYALLENVYTTNGDTDYYADIVDGTGVKKSYQLKDADAFRELENILMLRSQADIAARAEELEKDVTELTKMEMRVDPEDRVITYKLTSRNELRLDDANPDYKIITEDEFKSSTNKLGKVQLSESLSQIVDISDYEIDKSQSYDSLSFSDFVAGTQYDGIAYGETGSDKIYQFVLITNGVGGFNVTNNWAVFVQQTSVDTENNGDTEAVKAFVGNDQDARIIPVETDTLISGMTAGDIFFYKLNSDNEIEEIKPVTKKSAFNKNYQDFSRDAIENGFSNILAPGAADAFKAFSKPDKIKADDCDLIAGPIVDVSNGNISIASADQLTGTQTTKFFSIDDCEDYELASDVNVFVYDYTSATVKNRLSVSNKSAVRKSSFERDAYVSDEGEYGDKSDNNVDFLTEIGLEELESNSNYGNLNYAVAKIVDGDITEILVIIPDSSTK